MRQHSTKRHDLPMLWHATFVHKRIPSVFFTAPYLLTQQNVRICVSDHIYRTGLVCVTDAELPLGCVTRAVVTYDRPRRSNAAAS
jgi:hypothetical protein